MGAVQLPGHEVLLLLGDIDDEARGRRSAAEAVEGDAAVLALVLRHHALDAQPGAAISEQLRLVVVAQPHQLAVLLPVHVGGGLGVDAALERDGVAVAAAEVLQGLHHGGEGLLLATLHGLPL